MKLGGTNLISPQKIYKFNFWSASSFKENPLEVTNCLSENGFKPTLGIYISFQVSTSHASKILFWSCHPLPCNLQPWPIFKKFITKIGTVVSFLEEVAGITAFVAFENFFGNLENWKLLHLVIDDGDFVLHLVIGKDHLCSMLLCLFSFFEF